MFSKKNRSFLIMMAIYLLVSIFYILNIFKFSFDNKITLAFGLLVIPILFYYKNIKKLTTKKLWAFYIIIMTYHFAVFAFSLEMYSVEILFQIVLGMNLVATMLAYFLLHYSYLPAIEERSYIEITLVNENHEENLVKTVNFLDNKMPKFSFFLLEVIIVAAINAMLKYLSNETLSLVLQICLIIIVGIFNAIFVLKSMKDLPVKKFYVVKQVTLMFLLSVFYISYLGVFGNHQYLLYLSFLSIIGFYQFIDQLRYLTLELNELIDDKPLHLD